MVDNAEKIDTNNNAQWQRINHIFGGESTSYVSVVRWFKGCLWIAKRPVVDSDRFHGLVHAEARPGDNDQPELPEVTIDELIIRSLENAQLHLPIFPIFIIGMNRACSAATLFTILIQLVS